MKTKGMFRWLFIFSLHEFQSYVCEKKEIVVGTPIRFWWLPTEKQTVTKNIDIIVTPVVVNRNLNSGEAK